MFKCGLFNDKNGYLCKSESLSLARFKKAIRYDSCADPGIFVRWGSRSIWHLKKALTTFFFYFYFFSPQLVLQKSSGYFQRKLLFAKVPVGVDFFQGGDPTFYRGSNCFFPIETHKTCDFPRGQTPSGSAHRGLINLLVFNITFAYSFVERGGNVASAVVLPVVVVVVIIY